jgi:hypothetical protein
MHGMEYLPSPIQIFLSCSTVIASETYALIGPFANRQVTACARFAFFTARTSFAKTFANDVLKHGLIPDAFRLRPFLGQGYIALS